MKVSLKKAIELLQNDHVVAVPTETVYGLAACLHSKKAIKQIFFLKKRPADNPLIVHVSCLEDIFALVKNVPPQLAAISRLWPGSLTVVLEARQNKIPDEVRAGSDFVAVRIPKHPLLLQLIKEVGPLAAPSANLSGKPSATSYQHVEDDFGESFPVLDGGSCQKGVESTIIFLTKKSWQVLRLGSLSVRKIQKYLGDLPQEKTTTTMTVPGQKYRHYAPNAHLVLAERQKINSTKKTKSTFDAVIGFDDTTTTLPLLSLGKRNAFASNLKRLYQTLRQVDAKNYHQVVVDISFDKKDLGLTLYERLERASTK